MDTEQKSLSLNASVGAAGPCRFLCDTLGSQELDVHREEGNELKMFFS